MIEYKKVCSVLKCRVYFFMVNGLFLLVVIGTFLPIFTLQDDVLSVMKRECRVVYFMANWLVPFDIKMTYWGTSKITF